RGSKRCAGDGLAGLEAGQGPALARNQWARRRMTPERWQRIEQLYQAALQLHAGERSAIFATLAKTMSCAKKPKSFWSKKVPKAFWMLRRSLPQPVRSPPVRL